MRLQSAIFDMDGTLLDSMHTWRYLARNTLLALGKQPREDLEAHLRNRDLRTGAAYCVEAYGLDCSEAELMELLNARIWDFYSNHVQAKPGVERFLSFLKMEGVWMYVATATDRKMAEAGLRHTGLDRYFRGMLTCAEVGKWKEDPEIYERALRRLRSTKKDTVVFEDALYALQTAKNAGFRVAGVYDPIYQEDQPAIQALADYYIPSFEDLFEIE